MNKIQIVAITPLLILAFGIVLSLLLIAWQRSKNKIKNFTLIIFIICLVAVIRLVGIGNVPVTTLLNVDNYGLFSLALILSSAIVITYFSGLYLASHTEVHDEYYLLLQLVILGAGVLVFSDHFASVFLGFELLSIALVGMIGYLRESNYGLEAAFKYLVLSATASSFMLLGIAFIYGNTGSLAFANMNSIHHVVDSLYITGIVLFLVGLCFKLSLVPFHYWTPDVYQGSPTTVTLLLATVSKVAIFTVLLKYWFSQNLFNNHTLINVISVIAVLSMLFGNILALKQQSLKRLLGYSSIAHMGYLLILLLITSQQQIDFAWQAVFFYLVAYVLAIVSVFMVMMVSPQANDLHQQFQICQWKGLFWQKPLLATTVIISLLSFAGIPLTMGFISKFYLLTQATLQHLWWQISALIIGSGIALYYYLRIIFVLFEQVNDRAGVVSNKINSVSTNSTVTFSLFTRLIIFVFAGASILLGVLPDIFTYVLPL